MYVGNIERFPVVYNRLCLNRTPIQYFHILETRRQMLSVAYSRQHMFIKTSLGIFHPLSVRTHLLTSRKWTGFLKQEFISGKISFFFFLPCKQNRKYWPIYRQLQKSLAINRPALATELHS